MKHCLPLASLFLWLRFLPAQPVTTLHYSILMAGNVAGRETDTIHSDGSADVEYSFNDRGRGPEIRGRYRFDSRGFPSSVELTDTTT